MAIATFETASPSTGSAAPETLDGWRHADDRWVRLTELALNASIGVHTHELETPQEILISIELRVGPSTATSALVFSPPLRPNDPGARDVVCYEALSNAVADIIAAGHIDYVETLAERIALRCLQDDRVLEVGVRVEKPSAILAAKTAGVELRLRRPA
ncbi:MAG: dihydroneopterin aldolase [Rhodobacteraceae bacterium]|nr:dihydroneopterin aldolase [Paracoccaceae bacterium]